MAHDKDTHSTDKLEKKANLAKLETLKEKKKKKKEERERQSFLRQFPPPPHPLPSDTHPSTRNAVKLLVVALCVKGGGALVLSSLRPLLRETFAEFFLHNVESLPLWH